MKKLIAILGPILIPTCLYAVDGQVLINQPTVMAAAGFPYKISNPGNYKLSGNLTVTSCHTAGPAHDREASQSSLSNSSASTSGVHVMVTIFTRLTTPTLTG